MVPKYDHISSYNQYFSPAWIQIEELECHSSIDRNGSEYLSSSGRISELFIQLERRVTCSVFCCCCTGSPELHEHILYAMDVKHVSAAIEDGNRDKIPVFFMTVIKHSRTKQTLYFGVINEDQQKGNVNQTNSPCSKLPPQMFVNIQWGEAFISMSRLQKHSVCVMFQ